MISSWPSYVYLYLAILSTHIRVRVTQIHLTCIRRPYLSMPLFYKFLFRRSIFSTEFFAFFAISIDFPSSKLIFFNSIDILWSKIPCFFIIKRNIFFVSISCMCLNVLVHSPFPISNHGCVSALVRNHSISLVWSHTDCTSSSLIFIRFVHCSHIHSISLYTDMSLHVTICACNQNPSI